MMQDDDTQFRMACPKCKSYSFTVRRDQRAYVHKSQPFELVFSCRCGKQLFGDQIQEEYDRQKTIWDQEGHVAPVPEPVDEGQLEREREEERRKEQLRRAMEYRRKYLQDKRQKAEDEERERKDEEDRAWREKVAIVEAEGAVLRPTKPKASTRLSALTAVPEAPGSKRKAAKAPKRAEPAKPKPQPAAAAAAAPVAAPAPKPRAVPLSPDQVDVDPDHPHAEFMALLLTGTFFEHFPDCTPPDRKSEDLCVWPPCEKARRKKSKYCSRECSNKNARWRHKMRKKG